MVGACRLTCVSSLQPFQTREKRKLFKNRVKVIKDIANQVHRELQQFRDFWAIRASSGVCYAYQSQIYQVPTLPRDRQFFVL